MNENPDFYGPFWLMTTIIFLLSSTGNLSRYFSRDDKSDFLFKLELVRLGVVVVYSFGFGVPTVLYFVMKFFGCSRLTLPEVIFQKYSDDLHLWVLFELFYPYFPSLYHPRTCPPVDLDCLWNDKYDSIPCFQLESLLRRYRASQNVCSIRAYCWCSNRSIPYLQTSFL